MGRTWGARARRLWRRVRRPPEQLLMWLPSTAALPCCALPPDLAVRGWRSGDEVGWRALLAAGGQLGCWSAERLAAVMQDGWQREGQHFVVADDRLVACAGVFRRAWHGCQAWEVGWVATAPAYRRRGLGRVVTTAACLAARRLGPCPVYLRTDDRRLAALGLYLNLGFVPDWTVPGQRQRWERLHGVLDTGARVRLAGLIGWTAAGGPGQTIG